jgi:hypothetical protein
MQDVIPKGISLASVAWEIRPKPMKPTVRCGELEVVLSWGPQNANGSQFAVGH